VHVSNVAEQSGTLGLAFRTNPTKEVSVSEESPSIQEISRHVATLITRVDSLQSGVNEIKVSMEKLAEGHTTTREFQAEARRRLDDCAADRRDLWNKINDIRDREMKDLRDKVDDARADASTAMKRTQSPCPCGSESPTRLTVLYYPPCSLPSCAANSSWNMPRFKPLLKTIIVLSFVTSALRAQPTLVPSEVWINKPVRPGQTTKEGSQYTLMPGVSKC
jgi:hypothetical protein